jgi:hypothetical protein
MMLAGYTAAIIGFSSVDHPEAIFDTAAARVRDRAGHHLRHRVAQPVLAAVRGAEAGAETAWWMHDAEQWLRDAGRAARGEPTGASWPSMRWTASFWPRMCPMTHRIGARRRGWCSDALSHAAAAAAAFGQSWTAAARWARTRSWRRLLPHRGVAGRRCAAGGARLSAHGPAGARLAGLLRESFLVRLTQSATVIAECRQLLARLDNPDVRVPDELVAERCR